MKTIINLSVLLSISAISYAQSFRYSADIPSVDSTGYYKIELSPELIGISSEMLSDVRIYKEGGEEIPFVRDRESNKVSDSRFIEYKIISKKNTPEVSSQYIVLNKGKNKIDKISFKVRNTDVKKRARLSGSDNQSDWYVIKNDYWLNNLKNRYSTTQLYTISFPLSNYKYFKLEIDDENSLPIDIQKIGFYESFERDGEVSFISEKVVNSKDSLKSSYFNVSFDDTVYFENLRLKIDGPEFYQRDVSISAEQLVSTSESYFSTIVNSTVSSDKKNEFNIGAIKTKNLRIRVYNKDNQPLSITGIDASYFKQFLIVKLDPRSSYSIKVGNNELYKPQYDIEQFKNNLPKPISTLVHGELTLNNNPKPQSTDSDNKNQVYLIWAIILLVGGVLIRVSIKMINELNAKNKG
ncbi:hypothetical protein [Reichenbachiella versicolor]|uniref:hypothetical protein n=1 Tax=Reichenbachiella versicolor TaxID=1821036 RepID=UPI0013A593F6|nr:hypothetical protein [Reichenbachiella versicolor]